MYPRQRYISFLYQHTKTMKRDTANKPATVMAVLVLALYGVQLHYRYMAEFPAFVHSWSQTDRYAIALGFLNNGFDLFHPETLIFNKQFPHWWKHDDGSAITAVDLPIHEYVVAAAMRLSNSTSPIVFRLCTLLVALIGMAFLYKLAEELTGNRLKGLLVALVAIASPVYAYYAAGFIPGVPALSFAIIALWAYLRYLRGNGRYFVWAMAMATIATLIRTSFAILPVAMVCFEVLRTILRRTTLLPKLPAILLSAAAVGGYMAWNAHLRSLYDTVFLSGLMPAQDMDELKTLLAKAADNWKYSYFSKFQQWMFATVAVAATAWLIYKRFRKGKHISTEEEKPYDTSLWIFVGGYMVGCAMFAVVMAKQAPDHDYYFIDTLLLPTLLALALTLKALPMPKGHAATTATIIIVGLIGAKMLVDASKDLKQRRNNDDRAYLTAQAFEGSEAWLDSIGVGREATIMAMYAYPQNAPFILMNRRGYTMMWYDDDIVSAGMEFPYDYIVIENRRFHNDFPYHKQYLGHLQPLATNGKITLCRYSDTVVCHEVGDFIVPQK